MSNRLTAVAVSASIALGACSPRATSDPRGTSAVPDTAGLLVATVNVNAPVPETHRS